MWKSIRVYENAIKLIEKTTTAKKAQMVTREGKMQIVESARVGNSG